MKKSVHTCHTCRRMAAAALLSWSLLPALAAPALAEEPSGQPYSQRSEQFSGQPYGQQSEQPSGQQSGDYNESALDGLTPSSSMEDTRTLSVYASLSPRQLAVKADFLRLRVRWGEDFVFPINLSPNEQTVGQDTSDTGKVLAAGQNTSDTGETQNALEILSFQAILNLGEAPLDDALILPACPLPNEAQSVSIEYLERQLAAMTDSYSGEWSVYVKNLTTGDAFTINDVPMKSASVMKLFVLGTVYEAIENEELERTQEVVDLITTMICDSSNEATNRLLSMLGDGSYADGIQQVNEYISGQGYSSLTHEFNGFNDPAATVDPDHNNQISAADCGLLLERVYRRTFGSRSVCNEVEELMLNQNTRYKIPGGLPEEASVGNKTGEMSTVENDVAIIYGDKSDYILCVLSQDWDSGDTAITHIQEISYLVYQFFDNPAYYTDQEPDSFHELASLTAYLRSQEEEANDSEESENESPETNVEDVSNIIDIEKAFPLLDLGEADASTGAETDETETEKAETEGTEDTESSTQSDRRNGS